MRPLSAFEVAFLLYLQYHHRHTTNQFDSSPRPGTMSSSVFFKFKSQKEPQQIKFDGTGISVFELKRDIIVTNRLGEGTEFDLAIYDPDTNEGMSST